MIFKPAKILGIEVWRYAMVINDMDVERTFIEEGKNQMGLDEVPYDITNPENILNNLL